MSQSTTKPCPGCGAEASGNFCSVCGAGLGQRSCAQCRAELSDQARFCHRCGHAVASGSAALSPASERKVWFGAGAVCLLLVAAIAYQVSNAAGPAAPNMANAGSSTGEPGGGGVAPAGPAPDISAMTPRERFDRLFNRIMQAAERRDSAEVERFTPMALGAYRQLDAPDTDARYHAAVLQIQVGNFAAARALADTILLQLPSHLFGYLVRGAVAKLQGDSLELKQAHRQFLTHYAAEKAAKRVEYLEHEPVVEEFKREAEQR